MGVAFLIWICLYIWIRLYLYIWPLYLIFIFDLYLWCLSLMFIFDVYLWSLSLILILIFILDLWSLIFIFDLWSLIFIFDLYIWSLSLIVIFIFDLYLPKICLNIKRDIFDFYGNKERHFRRRKMPRGLPSLLQADSLRPPFSNYVFKLQYDLNEYRLNYQASLTIRF